MKRCNLEVQLRLLRGKSKEILSNWNSQIFMIYDNKIKKVNGLQRSFINIDHVVKIIRKTLTRILVNEITDVILMIS
jgi:hypothetical protein